MLGLPSVLMFGDPCQSLAIAMQEEGVRKHINLTDTLPEDNPILAKTLVCFVLVDRRSREHTFCSLYDFGPWPLLSGLTPSDVNAGVFDHFANTSAVMMNGFVFDELSPEVVSALAQHAHSSGAALFFDPGVSPRDPARPFVCYNRKQQSYVHSSSEGDRFVEGMLLHPRSAYALMRHLDVQLVAEICPAPCCCKYVCIYIYLSIYLDAYKAAASVS